MNQCRSKNKQTIDNIIQRIKEVYIHMAKLSNQVGAAEERWNNFDKTCAEFETNLDGMSNVFDGVKEKVGEITDQ